MPARERLALTGMVGARLPVIALLPPHPGHDSQRSVRVASGDVIDADMTEIVVDVDNFQEVA